MELEQYVCEVERKIKDNEIFLKQKELALVYAQSNVAEHRSTYEYNRKNMVFMKNRAGVVDIKEFRGVKTQLEKAQVEYDDALATERRLQGEAEHHRAIVRQGQQEIQRAKRELSTYGAVIEFKRAA